MDSIKAVNNRFPKDIVDPCKKLLFGSSEIVITTHHRPDGDAMGSSLALFNYLLKKGIKATVIVPSEYPDFLNWLPGNDSVIIYEKNPERSNEIISRAEIVFCLDFNWLSRIEKMEAAIRKSNSKKILIDHHLDPEPTFEFPFSYPDASSTCELIYQFIEALGDIALLDKSISECIYCGIMTDTNSFRFASMKADTHRIVATLMDAGAVNYRIHELVFDNATESKMRLLGYSLLNKLVVLREFNTAYISLSDEELKKYNFKTGDTEGLVNFALGMEGIVLGVFFSEKEDGVKISFRSKGDFSVKNLSAKYFSGGGHKNASGGFSKEGLELTVKKFLDVLPEYKAELNGK